MEKLFKPATKLPNRTPLVERMLLVKNGQATWPEPLLGTTCGSCAYFDTDHEVSDSQINRGFGRCRRARMVSGSWAKQIERSFMACSEYAVEEGEA